MKHFIFSLMILAGVNAVLAQSKFGKATWGPELKEASKSTMTGIIAADISKDKSKILLFDAAAFERDDTEKFAVTVYDGNMTEIWKSDIELPHKDRLFRISNYWVNNDGNFYLVGKVYKDKTAEKVKGEPNYSYAIIS